MNQKFKKWAGRIFMAALVMLFVFAFAYTLPADFALLAAIDMATYVDAFIGVYVVARIARLRPILAYARMRAAMLVRRTATRARRLLNRPDKGRNNAANDDHPWVALAA